MKDCFHCFADRRGLAPQPVGLVVHVILEFSGGVNGVVELRLVRNKGRRGGKESNLPMGEPWHLMSFISSILSLYLEVARLPAHPIPASILIMSIFMLIVSFLIVRKREPAIPIREDISVPSVISCAKLFYLNFIFFERRALARRVSDVDQKRLVR